jgi:hypothetical protein
VKTKNIITAALLSAVACLAHASKTYDSYDAYYSSHSAAVFNGPAKSGFSEAFDEGDAEGVKTTFETTLDGRPLHITLAADRVIVNGTAYRHVNAITFPTERHPNFSPLSAQVYIAPRRYRRPALVCVQGVSVGSGEYDRHEQIYLLVDPLARRGGSKFFHLPSLLSSCQAVIESPGGKISFPSNSYLFNESKDTRIGVQLVYYTIEGSQFVAAGKRIHAHFIKPSNVFRFTIDNGKP